MAEQALHTISGCLSPLTSGQLRWLICVLIAREAAAAAAAAPVWPASMRLSGTQKKLTGLAITATTTSDPCDLWAQTDRQTDRHVHNIIAIDRAQALRLTANEEENEENFTRPLVVKRTRSSPPEQQ